MEAEPTAASAVLLTPRLDERWLGVDAPRGWRSRLGPAVAVVAHLIVFGGATGAFDGAWRAILGSPPPSHAKPLSGDRAGALDGVAAEIIDAVEFNRRYVSFDPGRAEADAKPAVQSPPQDVNPEQPEPKAAEAAPGDGWAPARPEPVREKAKTEPALTATEASELLAQTMEDLQGSAALVSTPGAARLGEASPYVRSVLRTLKASMPRPPGLRGTVVIQLVVATAGGVEAVRIVRSSGNPALDRVVAEGVLKTRIAAPPASAPPRERMFQVSYEYR